VRYLKLALVFAVIVLVCGAASVPWPGNWDDQVPGRVRGEIWTTLWHFNHISQAMFESGELEATERIQPEDAGDLTGAMPLALPILASPFTNSMGASWAVNLATWLGLILACMAGALFFAEVAGDFWAGVIAGLAYGVSGYALSEVSGGAVAAGCVFLLPLACFLFIRFLDSHAALYGIAATGLFVLTAYDHFTFGLIALIFALAVSIRALFDEGISAFVRGLLVIVAAIVLLLPRLLALTSPDPIAPIRSLDLVDPFLFGSMTPHIFPVLPLLMAVVGTLFIHHLRAFWWTLAGTFFLLALGPTVTAFGNATSIPGPFALLQSLPGMPAILDPYRLVVGVTLALCALAALAIRGLLDTIEKKGKDESLATRGVFLLVAVIAVIFAPGDKFRPEIPAEYERIMPWGNVLELPISKSPAVNASFLYAQKEHRAPSIGGPPFRGRWVMPPYDALQPNKTLASLAEIGSHGLDKALIDKADLTVLGVSHVILHLSEMDGEPGVRLTDTLHKTLGEPVHIGGLMIVHRVDP
jgi:hypothetical protein